MVHSLIRWLKREPPLVTKEQALAIAKQECETRDWSWARPIRTSSRCHTWRVCTSYGNRGLNGTFVIDKYTGNVLEAWFVPR